MKKLKTYDVAFEGIAIIEVRADCEEGATCIAFQDISTGDFEIRDHSVSLKEESEKE